MMLALFARIEIILSVGAGTALAACVNDIGPGN
jgi:hypothetical protein